MAKKLMFMLLCLVALSCKRNIAPKSESCDIIETFNSRASELFKSKYLGSNEFDVLGASNKCILEKTAVSYLDDSNNWSTTVIDSFYIRSFGYGYYFDIFSFVSNVDGDMYFIYSPEFHDRIENVEKYYSIQKSQLLELKDTVGNSILKLNIKLLNTFIDNEVSYAKSFEYQLDQARRILPKLMPHLLREKSHKTDLFNSLSTRQKATFDEIKVALEPVFPTGAPRLGSSTDNEVYRNFYGYVVVHYKRSEENSEKLKIEFYFVPDQFRRIHRNEVDFIYDDCFKQP